VVAAAAVVFKLFEAIPVGNALDHFVVQEQVGGASGFIAGCRLKVVVLVPRSALRLGAIHEEGDRVYLARRLPDDEDSAVVFPAGFKPNQVNGGAGIQHG
jgi:hypothetical protein